MLILVLIVAFPGLGEINWPNVLIWAAGIVFVLWMVCLYVYYFILPVKIVDESHDGVSREVTARDTLDKRMHDDGVNY
jgi:hypothetical protein